MKPGVSPKKLFMTGTISIKNVSEGLTEIDIDGIIGIPEEMQFEDDGTRVATFEKFKETIEKIQKISSGEIVVNIRSTGGNVNDAILIYESLAELPCPVTTRCYGYVASAATIIAQAADPGRREVSESCLYLIHKSVSASEGNALDISETIDLLEKTDNRIAAIYSAHSGRDEEEFRELMACNNGNGKWLTAIEVIEEELADEIIPNPKKTDKKDRKTGKEIVSNLKKHWNAIMDLIGVRDVVEIPDNKTNGEALQKTISDLENKVRTLETENARLGALPTMTEPAEDPHPTEVVLSSNRLSYDNDIRSIISK